MARTSVYVRKLKFEIHGFCRSVIAILFLELVYIFIKVLQLIGSQIPCLGSVVSSSNRPDPPVPTPDQALSYIGWSTGSSIRTETLRTSRNL